MVNIVNLDDAPWDIFELEASPVVVQSLQQVRDKKWSKTNGQKIKKTKKLILKYWFLLIPKQKSHKTWC